MRIYLPLFVATFLVTPAAWSGDVLVKHKCNTCHDVQAKKLGPTWKTIAAKATPEDIKTALLKGVKGKYGKAVMPPQPKAVPDADAIAKAILAMK